ncbi:dsDNA nuclease domain-containing protein [Chloroflexota bacterium]
MTNPLGINPPDDTGADTFVRFCYQAYIAFRYCLVCSLGQGVVSVIPEHFEDIAVEYPDGWDFIQVKTRDLDLGPWTFSNLLAEKGGALRSLHRTFRHLRHTSVNYTLTICLEGPVKARNEINLLTGKEDEKLGLHERICQRLDIMPDECEEFLSRVLLRANEPTRDSILARNLRYLGMHAPGVNYDRLTEIHQAVIQRILASMQSQLIGEGWPLAVLGGEGINASARKVVENKRLTIDTLSPLFGKLMLPQQPLLQELVDHTKRVPTIMEEKLTAGGATPEIISDAETLRANSTAWMLTRAAASLQEDTSETKDLQIRLKTLAHAQVASYTTERCPAIGAWNELLTVLMSQAAKIDVMGLFNQDPFMLMGEICNMTEDCIVEWGRADA